MAELLYWIAVHFTGVSEVYLYVQYIMYRGEERLLCCVPVCVFGGLLA